MHPFIFPIAFILVPAALHWLGWRIVGLSFAAACLWGLGGVVLILWAILPPETAAAMLDLIRTDEVSINNSYHDAEIYYVIASYQYALIPTAVFATIWLVFCALKRAAAPIPRRTTTLFWVAHLSIIAVPMAPAIWQHFVGMPRRYVDYADAFSLLNTITTTFACIAIASLTLMLIIAIRSAYNRIKGTIPRGWIQD